METNPSLPIQHFITKEQLATLPLVTFPGRITVIETHDSAVEALQALNTEAVVGFDTETKPSFRKGAPNKMSLIQLSTLDHCYLFRINKTGFIDELAAFMLDQSVLKIGLSIKDDFYVLHRSVDIEPQGFIDLQSYVREFNISDSSLQKIYALLFRGRISKGQRLSNWEAPELTEHQQIYAAIDAWACLRIYLHLRDGHFKP
ncbi:MAG: 3'-5' exonuclease domain-containing protein 2 [Bacteroidales bacterium]|nr:3'-5' exonuclease domain-containing protein 2 [Bacteroidales bacterium]